MHLKTLFLGALCAQPLVAQEASHLPRPDCFEPIAVMGAHTHSVGEWMFSIRARHMSMDELLDGSRSVTPESLQGPGGYMNVPIDMDMQMVMFGAMYSLNDDVTLMAMLPYVSKSMTMRHVSGNTFETRSEGLGDVSLSGLFQLDEATTASLRLTLPTGSVTERDSILGMGAMPIDVRLPYPMQLGSGTFDLSPGITWKRAFEDSSIGVQAQHTLRLGRNDEGYSLGDATEVSAWWARPIGRADSLSVRASYQERQGIDGADDSQGTMGGMPGAAMTPTADPDLQGGRRLDLVVGWSHLSSPSNRFGIEVGLPIDQHLDGPQMAVEGWVALGWQFGF